MLSAYNMAGTKTYSFDLSFVSLSKCWW